MRAGAARGFEFTPGIVKRAACTPQRWIVWFYEDDTWKRLPGSMPDGAAGSYADSVRRYAGAIAMEAVSGL